MVRNYILKKKKEKNHMYFLKFLLFFLITCAKMGEKIYISLYCHFIFMLPSDMFLKYGLL